MIFQTAFDLEVKDKNVQAIIDFDTGLVGFTEVKGENVIEYFYADGPKEFKVAFFQKLEDLMSTNSFVNLKISRKSNQVNKIQKILTDKSSTKN